MREGSEEGKQEKRRLKSSSSFERDRAEKSGLKAGKIRFNNYM